MSSIFGTGPYVPFDPEVGLYELRAWGEAHPLEYTGWKDEVLSWKKTCYLHGGLNPTLTYRLTGPDAARLLADHSVNSFAKFEVGSSKHLVMCNEYGNVMVHGVCLRVGPEEFMTYWLAPYLVYLVETKQSEYDVTGEDISGTVFLFQVAGPRSLEILEQATQQDLHDIRFLRHRGAEIVGGAADGGDAEVTVLRLGMAGTLAYEIHGRVEDAQSVYRAIMSAGEPFGIRQLSRLGYLLNHTENGFVQSGMHFMRAWEQDPDFMRFQHGSGWGTRQHGSKAVLRGSMGDSLAARYLSPFDAGWGHIVKFDHHFLGREALEGQAINPPRSMVTFVWNPEDILDVYASQFRDGTEYQFMDFVYEFERVKDRRGVHVGDQVLKDGELVGFSAGRIFSYYYRVMISIGPISTELAQLGEPVRILWGAPGGRQKEIRATVERFPYLDLPRNEQIDVNTIPRLAGDRFGSTIQPTLEVVAAASGQQSGRG